MKKKFSFLIPISLLIITIGVLFYFAKINDLSVISPHGAVGIKQRNLLVFATLLGMIVIIPVFMMAGFFAWRYREGNTKTTYKPNWDKNHLLEAVWWGIPIIIIVILSVVTWRSTHELDPFRPLESDKQPVRIQVVALRWKWLFIYPDQGFATVNHVQFPEKTPINFEITADAPMNSFWIPSLGGQIYAMNGMTTKLHLEANEPGEYAGVSSNISGEGFASMNFRAVATDTNGFNKWIEESKQRFEELDLHEYNNLSQPTIKQPETVYGSVDNNLYDKIVMKYMDQKQKINPNMSHAMKGNY